MEMILKLRNETGCSLLDAKTALQLTKYDYDKAKEILTTIIIKR